MFRHLFLILLVSSLAACAPSSATMTPTEIPYSSGFQGDYYKTMTQWLVENVK